MKKRKIQISGMIGLFVLLLCSCGPQGEAVDATFTGDELLVFSEAGDSFSDLKNTNEEALVIKVFVCGAVKAPGVVELLPDSRVQDALLEAGGFSEAADKEYVNLAARVADGQRIYFPTAEEAGALRKEEQAASSELVDINLANARELCTLPGIGESRAAEIIRYREKQGTFSCIEDLKKVECITESIYTKLADQIMVSE